MKAFISRHVSDFLRSSIGTVTDLELLFLLRRSPETFWTAPAASAAMNANEERVTAALAAFVRAGMVEQARTSPAFRYAPSDRRRNDLVEDLVVAYDEHRAGVLDLARIEFNSATIRDHDHGSEKARPCGER